MYSFFKRFMAVLLCGAMLAGFMLLPPLEVQAAHYTDYETLALIYNQGDCPSMQGCCSDDTYIYCSKINTTTETSAAISRTHRETGSTVWLTNGATGTYFFSQLAHANDLDVADITGVKTLFVATGGAGVGDYALVRFAVEGTTATEVAHYNMIYNGSSTYLASAQVMSVEGDNINLICKRGKYIFTATVGVTQTEGDVEMQLLCTLDLADVNVNGTSKDLSTYVQQGFEYYDGRIYVPMTEPNDMITSCIIAYDVIGVSGTIKNNPILSVWITSSTYADLFEIESCTICPSDGRLYFNTNRRKTSSDSNHDGIHYLPGYVYNAADGDSTAAGSYRWDVENDKLASVTTDGASYNHAQIIKGTVSSGAITGGQYSLDQAVILKHGTPWIIEWKSSAMTSNSLLLSQQAKSNYNGNLYLYTRKDGLVSFGTSDGSKYYNYGINITNHGFKTADAHIYRLENRINADGSNMVYLTVDGVELGAMNNYYLGGTAQNTTDTWLSGKDFAFNYLGTTQHPLASSLSYLRIWGEGVPGQVDEPNTYRWETQSDKLTAVEDFALTSNAATALYGTCADGTYSNYQAALAKDVVLLHDRPWTLEWKSDSWSGGGMVLAAAPTSKTYQAPYLFRSAIVGFGWWDGSQYMNYGIKLSDHGIDGSVAHTYRLTNKLAADGSNMVYLSVDGVELGAMNNCFVGTAAQNTTSDWLSGRDLTFSYVGTYQHDVNGAVPYIQVWENGIPAEQGASVYRWESIDSTLTSVTTDNYKENNAALMAGSCSGTTFTDSWFRLDKSVVLLHDRSWSIQWESEGTWRGDTNGAMLLSASRNRNELNAPYLYRRGSAAIIAFGVRGDGNHYNYGINLADHGIDAAAKHTYLLTNKVNADGSNMVYLSVDGVELGAMNNYFIGSTAQGTTDNWISGKDFVFSYLGTPQFPIDSCSITYLQIDESCNHSYGDWTVTTAATCITDGSRTRSCTLCGETQTEVISAAGHRYGSVVTAPTCTVGGYTTYTCSSCGNTYQSDTTAAAGHSYEAVVTAPTCTEGGYTTYTCTGCGDSYKGSYTDPTGHSYAEGVCTACGAADPNYVQLPSITLRYPTVSFEDEILMNVYFNVDVMDDVWELGLLTYSESVDQADINTAGEVIPGYTYNSTSGLLCVTTNGIPAKCLGDQVWLSVYAKMRNGEYVYSRVVSYSPMTYAYTQLDYANEATKALMVALLNYGAAAQTFFNYNTDALVSSDLTADHLALIEDYRADMMATVATPAASKQGAFVNTGGYAKRYPTISFEGAFCINYYYTPSYAPVDGITMYYWDQAAYDAADVLTAENATGALKMEGEGTGEYLAVVEGIAAKDLDKGIYVSFCYSDGTTSYASGVLAYSIGSYCTTQAGYATALQPFAKATAVYGYYAKQLFYEAA